VKRRKPTDLRVVTQRGPLLTSVLPLAPFLFRLPLPLAFVIGDPIEAEFFRMVVSQRRPGFKCTEEEFFQVLGVFLPLESAGGSPVPIGRLARFLQVLRNVVEDRSMVVSEADMEVPARGFRRRRGRAGRRHARETPPSAYNSSADRGRRGGVAANA
jgi:hypothetical protein